MPPRYPPYSFSAVQWPQQLYYPGQYPPQYQWGYQQMPFAGGPPMGNPYPNDFVSPRQKKKRRSLTPPPDVELHQLLGGRYRPTAIWDVTQEPSHVRHLTKHGTAEKVPPPLLREPATNPGAHYMKVVCDAFPWDITINLPRGEEITVGIIMEAIHGSLQEPLERDEWEEESNNSRKRMHKAMCNRLARGPPRFKVDEHVRRIDFLADKTVFMGLKPQGPPDAPEVWLLKLGAPPRK